MKIEVTFISQVEELTIGTVDGLTYGTAHLLRAEAYDDGDNVYPH